MSAPRLEIDLGKIDHNARTLIQRLRLCGISVTGITKSTLGVPALASILINAGVDGLGDSHIENIERLHRSGVTARMVMIRTPMLSQTSRIIQHANISFNTELDVIAALSSAAHSADKTHGVVLMVELGDLREGILPGDLMNVVHETLHFPNIVLKGIGANLACLSGASPDAVNMAELSGLADTIDAKFGLVLDIVSGGNSANLEWALSGADTGRVNNLRLGESILFGCEALHRQPIDGLHTDAVTLIAEVIESKSKPSLPWGVLAQNAFGETPPTSDRGPIAQAILSIGRQDTDPSGLSPPAGMEILGASSDHLVLDTGRYTARVGEEITFQTNYSALLRSMTSPFVEHILVAPA